VTRPTVHILSQYIWPDDAPTGVYAGHLADALSERGISAVLVGGQGSYRTSQRPPPKVPIRRLPHTLGVRGNIPRTLAEYGSLFKAYRDYVRTSVQAGDLVVASSAPPTTPWLIGAIRGSKARGIYWLQDYYPELVRGVMDYPYPLRRAFGFGFDAALRSWDCVVKIGANLDYEAENARVVRNWPTLAPAASVDPVPSTALYSGNLGYGHDVGSLVSACRVLLDLGWQVTIRADGPGVAKLPSWLSASPLLGDQGELAVAYARADAHLIAGHPEIERAIFPSKVWNALATGRPVIATGFGPLMKRELDASRASDPSAHLSQWVRTVEEFLS
jgi:hypothetical protein